MAKSDHSAPTQEEGHRESQGREEPESHRKYLNGHPAVDELRERKRKRTADNNDFKYRLNGVASQKRRATDKNISDPTPVVSSTQHNKPPNHQRTRTPATPVNNEIHVAGSPGTDTLESAQSQKPLARDADNTIDPLFLELPFLPPSPSSEPEEPPEQDIDTWIDTRLQTGRAENEEQIIEALRCTSMDPYLADKVLDYLTAGKGIPDNIPGVWTPEDDRCIEAEETRPIERVLKKHGSESFNARWEYLGMARAAGLDGADS
jgi:telomeric repeat-binding factor 2-interacting protein 1